MYNRAAAAWQSVLRNIDEALKLPTADPALARSRSISFGEIISDSFGKLSALSKCRA